MNKIFYKSYGLFITDSINADEEPDVTCECCGKHISQIEPYNGDGIYKEAYLIKTFRPCGPCDEDGYAEFSSSWECKDCVALNDDQYLDKRLPESDRTEKTAVI